jgi:hypothetical protein
MLHGKQGDGDILFWIIRVSSACVRQYSMHNLRSQMPTSAPDPQPNTELGQDELEPIALARIQELFHGLIRSRARESGIPVPKRLPTLARIRAGEAEPRWFAVPGMYGGFAYRLHMRGGGPQLITESWSRVVGGSGMRHVITPTQVILEEEGMV